MDSRSKLKSSNWPAVVLVGIIPLLVVVMLILQITTAQNTTKLETTLFSILQFIFSLIFAWILARASMKNEFRESQKKFAVAAYRRINEIDRGVNRLLRRTRRRMEFSLEETQQEIEVVASIATGISDSIKSSMADWGDIIGEEITTFQEIEKLREKGDNDLFYIENVKHEIEDTSVPTSVHLHKSSENFETKIQQLLNSLPMPLQIEAKAEQHESVMENVQEFCREQKKYGFIILTGFWDPSFSRDIKTFTIGTNLPLRIGNVDKRRGALIAYDDENQSVGIITNTLDHFYHDFTDAFLCLMGSPCVYAEIVEINKKILSGHRNYFKLKITSSNRNYFDIDKK